MPVSKTSPLVIDSGLALIVVLPHPYREFGRRFWQQWMKSPSPLFAPYLWISEVTSGLRRAVWERILTEKEAEAALEQLLHLPVTFVPESGLASRVLTWAHQLQQKRAYDAFYVALAELRGLEFWSADRRLVRTLQHLGYSWAHWVGELQEDDSLSQPE